MMIQQFFKWFHSLCFQVSSIWSVLNTPIEIKYDFIVTSGTIAKITPIAIFGIGTLGIIFFAKVVSLFK